MDVLQELIKSLNEKERKLFRKYLLHKSNKSNRKDLLIFEHLLQNEMSDAKKIIEKLYGRYSRKDAISYHSLRKFLKVNLENFILQQKNTSNNQLQISRLTNLAQNLYYHKKYNSAWHYLTSAELIAGKAEEYELLNQIYQLMIEYAWTQPSNVLKNIIKKVKRNRAQAKIIYSMNLALSVIHNKLSSLHKKGKKADIGKIVQESLKEFNVDKIVAQKASERYKLAMLVKMSLEEENNFEELYRYMIQTLEEMETAKQFDKYNYKYRIELLNVICIAASRARDYQTAEKYIQIIETENANNPERDLLSLRSYMAKMVCLAHTNRKREALKVLQFLEIKYKKLYHDDDYLFTRLNSNIASIQFELGNISIPRRCLNELLSYPKRIMRHLGLEMLFYCHAIECLLAIEANNIEFAISRIHAIERKYKELLEQPHNIRNNEFVKLLRTILNSKAKEIWNDKKFRSEAWKFIYMEPIYKPGREFISFNAWLFSKLKKTQYGEAEYNAYIESKSNNLIVFPT